MSEVTLILSALQAGDRDAPARLLPAVYEELRALARHRMHSERPGHTLGATALVHEAYLRLLGPTAGPHACFDGRGHFFAAAAEAMRRILIDHARRRLALRHGQGHAQVPLADDLPVAAPRNESPEEILDLDAALTRLAALDSQKAELVKLLYFVGLSLEEAADILGISRATAHRYWTFTKAWLHDAIRGASSRST